MVNQMMNTLNKEDLLFSRKYRWDKKWVRPYESIFSILANFCRVNICSSKHALKMLGAEATNEKKYIEGFQMDGHCRNSLETIECLNKILPQWYIDKMEIFAHMDYNTARSYFGTYHMRICPKCLKDGYHSIIHQFHYVKTCPFHPGTGTDGRFVFEHNFYHAEGIRCSPYEKGTGFNAYLLPLPCCRTNPNDFYDTDVINRSFEKYGKVYTSNISYLYSPILSKEADKTPIISKMYVDRRPETYDCFQAGFFTWFNQQNVVYNPFERIKKFFRIMPAEYDSYDMADCFLFAKYMSIIGEGIFSLSENDVNTLHYVDSIRDSDMTLLAICFTWIMQGFEEPSDAISAACLGHNIRPVMQRNLRSYTLEDVTCVGGIRFYEIGESEADKVYLKLFIMSDMIDDLWIQFKKSATSTGGVYISDPWNTLIIPTYQVLYLKHEDMYEIRKC